MTTARSGRIECIRYTYLAEGIPVLMSSAEDRMITRNSAYVPEKYALPEACDFEFCRFLKLCGEPITFAVFNAKRTRKKFHGLTLVYFNETVSTDTELPLEVGSIGLI